MKRRTIVHARIRLTLLATLLAAAALPALAENGEEGGGEPVAFIELTFPQMQLQAVLQMLQPYFERPFVIGPNVAEAFNSKTISFPGVGPDRPLRIEAQPGHEVEAAYNFFQTLLSITGFSIVERADVLEIVVSNERHYRPVRIFNKNEIDLIPATDELFTLLYSFDNYNPSTLERSIFTNFVDPTAEKVWVVENTNTIVLTTFGTKLQQYLGLFDLIDRQNPTVELRIAVLENTSAEVVIPTLQDLWEARAETRQGEAPSPPGQPRRPNAPAGPPQQRPPAKIIASPTNPREIILLAVPADLDALEDLIAQLDTAVDRQGSRVRFFKLRYRSVTTQGAGEEGAAQQTQKGMAELLREILASRAEAAQEEGEQATGSSAGRPGGQPTLDELLAQVRIVEDPDSNTLIVTAPHEEILDYVGELIAQLDTRRPQVFIEAVIMELGETASRDLGIELATLDRAADGSIRGAAASSHGLATPQADPPGLLPNFGSGLTAFIFKDRAESIPLLLRMMQSDGESNVLAVPRLLTNDNTEANFNITRSVPFQTTNTGGSGITTTSVEYAEANTELRIHPSVGEDEDGNYYVRLRIGQSIGTFGARASPDLPPPQESREIETGEVTLPDGATVIFGGFTDQRETTEISKIPLLGDIPLLGLLFRRKTTSVNYTTIFVFLTPHVITDNAQVTNLRDRIRTSEELEDLRDSYRAHFHSRRTEAQRRRDRDLLPLPHVPPSERPPEEEAPPEPGERRWIF